MTQAEAHRALAAFIAGSRAADCAVSWSSPGMAGSAVGVLKAAVPRWLEEPDLRHAVWQSRRPSRSMAALARSMCYCADRPSRLRSTGPYLRSLAP